MEIVRDTKIAGKSLQAPSPGESARTGGELAAHYGTEYQEYISRQFSTILE